MSQRAIVFACANPVPEIYPEEAKKAGAEIVATGRSDFPNQLNNSLVFPGLLKAVIETSATKITDSMALAAAKTIANTLENEELTADKIVPLMEDKRLVPNLLKNVSREIVQKGLNQKDIDPEELCAEYQKDIARIKKYTQEIPIFPQKLIDDAILWTKEKLLER